MFILVFSHKLIFCIFICLKKISFWIIREVSDAARDWGQEEKGTTEDEMAGWHHWLNGRGFGWTLGVGDGQGGLVCCDSRGRKESDTTEQLNWTELAYYLLNIYRYMGFSSGSAMATHSSTLAWKIPWTEEPGRLQSMGSLRVRHDWATSLSLFTFMHCRRKWQPTPVFLPGESQGRRSLVGCRLWGHTESDTTEVTQQQQQQQQLLQNLGGEEG